MIKYDSGPSPALSDFEKHLKFWSQYTACVQLLKKSVVSNIIYYKSFSLCVVDNGPR